MTATRSPGIPLAWALRNRIYVSAKWGTLDMTPDMVATATRSFHADLRLYSPGIGTAQRRLLHARYTLSSWSGVAVFVLALLIGLAIGGWVGLFVALTIVAVLYSALMISTRRTARQTRTVRVTATPDGLYGEPAFNEVAEQLDELDRSDLNPVDYEAQWWRIYTDLDVSQRTSGREQW